jgi:hypothetical protein
MSILDENGINQEITGKCTSDRKKGEQTMSDGKEFLPHQQVISRLKITFCPFRQPYTTVQKWRNVTRKSPQKSRKRIYNNVT